MNTNFEKLNAWECSGTMLTNSVQVDFSQRITSGTIYKYPGLNKSSLTVKHQVKQAHSWTIYGTTKEKHISWKK